jgi:hypothetical protein
LYAIRRISIPVATAATTNSFNNGYTVNDKFRRCTRLAERTVGVICWADTTSANSYIVLWRGRVGVCSALQQNILSENISAGATTTA